MSVEVAANGTLTDAPSRMVTGISIGEGTGAESRQRKRDDEDRRYCQDTHRPNETQAQPPLAGRSFAAGFTVEVI